MEQRAATPEVPICAYWLFRHEFSRCLVLWQRGYWLHAAATSSATALRFLAGSRALMPRPECLQWGSIDHPYNRNALHLASEGLGQNSGQEPVDAATSTAAVRLLLELGVDPTARDEVTALCPQQSLCPIAAIPFQNGCTPLLAACRSWMGAAAAAELLTVPAVQALVKQGDTDKVTPTRELSSVFTFSLLQTGNTALEYALCQGACRCCW